MSSKQILVTVKTDIFAWPLLNEIQVNVCHNTDYLVSVTMLLSSEEIIFFISFLFSIYCSEFFLKMCSKVIFFFFFFTSEKFLFLFLPNGFCTKEKFHIKKLPVKHADFI